MVYEQIIAAIDYLFSPLKIFPPHITLAVLSIVLTVLVIGIGRLVTNKKILAEIKAKTQELRLKLTQAQKEGNKDAINQLFGELMKVNNENMKHSFKMMAVSLVVIAIFLPWAQQTYAAKTVAVLPFTLPFIGSNLNWVYWYILVSFSVGWVVRKLFGFE